MSQKVFMGSELPGVAFSCDLVVIGDYEKVLGSATEHIIKEHDVDFDTQIIVQTIRDYNESSDGPEHECSHV